VEQVWGAALGSSVGEQEELRGAALHGSFEEPQLWGVVLGTSFRTQLWGAAFASNFGEQLSGAAWELCGGAALGNRFEA
jgi:hypothetical protein